VCRPREPPPCAAWGLDYRAGLLLQHGLPQVPLGDADVLTEREDFGVRQPVADVPLPRLQLRRAADDALERLAADQLARHL